MNLSLTNPLIEQIPSPVSIPSNHNTPLDSLLLHLGEAWYPPAPAVLDTLYSIGPSILRYPDNLSCELREQIALYCGNNITKDNIFVGNGSDCLIDLIARAFAGPNRPIAAPSPTFFVYGHSALLAGASIITTGRKSQQENFAFDVDLFLDALPKETGVIFLASPNNPTGDSIDESTIKKIVRSTQAIVVIDECYFEFCGNSAIELFDKYPNLVILRSLSKSFALAGLRCGYAVAHTSITNILAKMDQTFSVNIVAQKCSVTAIKAISYYNPLFTKTRELRQIWSDKFDNLGFHVFPSSANIALLDYSAVSTVPLAPLLKKEGIYVADFHERNGVNNCMRITISDIDALNRVLTALTGILQK